MKPCICSQFLYLKSVLWFIIELYPLAILNVTFSYSKYATWFCLPLPVEKDTCCYFFTGFLFGWCWVSVAAGSFLSLQRVGSTLWLRCTGCSLQELLLLQSTDSRVFRLQWLWHTGPMVAAPRLWSTGSVAGAHGLSCSRHLTSPRVRDRTHVSCAGRWILYLRATREAPPILFAIRRLTGIGKL